MTQYTAYFTATAVAEYDIEADSPEQALQRALSLRDNRPYLLDFTLINDDFDSIDRIVIAIVNEDGSEIEDNLAVWESEKWRSRLAADRLLKTIQDAIAILPGIKSAGP